MFTNEGKAEAILARTGTGTYPENPAFDTEQKVHEFERSLKEAVEEYLAKKKEEPKLLRF